MKVSTVIKNFVNKAGKKLTNFEPQKNVASTLGISSTLMRNQFREILPYQYIDENGYVFIDDNDTLIVGFGFSLGNPLIIQGEQIAKTMNGLFSKLPTGAVFTSSIYSSAIVGYKLDEWANTKDLRRSTLSTLMVGKRKEFLEGGALDYTLYPSGRMHSREVQHNAFIRIPFRGDMRSEEEISSFMDSVDSYRDTVMGIFVNQGLAPRLMDKVDFHFLLWHLLNPQRLKGDQRAWVKEQVGENVKLNTLVHKNTRVGVSSKSSLIFSDGDQDNFPDKVEVVPMTVDEYPDYLVPIQAGSLMGALLQKDDRISAPFFMYSNVEIVDADKAIKDISWKQMLIRKQLVSDSEFAKNQFAALFARRDNGDVFLKHSKGQYRPVRMMTGINIYTTPKERERDVENVVNLFKVQDYQVSVEGYIGVPAFISSLPFLYDPKTDRPNKGLQRSQMVSSFNAACGMHMSGEWKGTSTRGDRDPGGPVRGGGIMLEGPKGQLAPLDIFQSSSNYNGVVIGTSGAGKSYMLAEVASDVYCRDGVVRIVDVGRSYYNLCEFMGGQNIVFDSGAPISLNPFWGVSEESEFKKLEEFWRDLIVTMAYPEGRDSSSWEFRFIQSAIGRAWRIYKEKLELGKILSVMNDLYNDGASEEIIYTQTIVDEDGVEVLGEDGLSLEKVSIVSFDLEPREERILDVIYQLNPYGTPNGSYYQWFQGPCQLELSNDFMVFELDELGTSPELKAVVLMLITNQIERELYLSDRSRWRLTIIDEAYDLLRREDVGRVIEYLFRKARKYRGSCLVGTQGYDDLYHNVSTRGIVANAAWKFTLKQEGVSAKKAFDESIIPDTEYFRELVGSVGPGDGYGEILVKTPSGDTFLYRFVTDPFSFYMYSSKDMATVNRLAKDKLESGEVNSLNEGTALAIKELSDKHLKKYFTKKD